MRRLIIGLTLALALVGVAVYAQEAPNSVIFANRAGQTYEPRPSICDDAEAVDSLTINMSAATGNTQIRALEAGYRIYVCGYSLKAGGAATISIVVGTGTACATNELAKATYTFSAATEIVMIPNGGAPQFKGAVGDALCVDRGTSVTLSGHVTFVRVDES